MTNPVLSGIIKIAETIEVILTETLEIAVCEDDKNEYEKLPAILDNSGVDVTVEHFTDGAGLLAQYYNGKYDLLLLDIYMAGMNGIYTVAKIRESDSNVPVAFLTTSLDHALDGYRYHVDRYITKPLHTEEITEILQKALQRCCCSFHLSCR